MEHPTTPARHPGHRRGALVVAVAFALSAAFATLPTPLYAEYRRAEGFSSLTVTVVFAAFAVGVLLALGLAGHLSDVHGRRRLLLAAGAAQVLSAAVFVATTELPGVLLARVLCGVGVGLLVPTATAALAELLVRGRTAASTVVVANLGGLAAGPLVGTALLAVTGTPLRDPFLVLGAALVVATAALLLVPETRAPAQPRPPYRPQRLAVPPDARATFWSLALASCAAFAVLGSYAALAPRLMADVFAVDSVLLANLPVTLLFGCAALGQLATASWSTSRRLAGAAVFLGGGLALVATTALAANLPGALVAAAVAGTGVGLAFRSAVAGVVALAPPERRSGVTASLLLVTYAGLTVPVVAVGLLAEVASATTTLVTLAAVVGTVVVLTTGGGARVLSRAEQPRDAGHGERGGELQQVAGPTDA
ncbi:MFS transporter [Nocardioides sp. CPCC 205120]|uniref:MFS transporter n=1 Tax=Nocardioides sp. CPCC 205120 TaxID=3406462 RepID=UPI003B5142EF